MKIIKNVSVKPKETKKTCYKCKTKFSFTPADIKFEFWGGYYVICPSCGVFMEVKMK